MTSLRRTEPTPFGSKCPQPDPFSHPHTQESKQFLKERKSAIQRRQRARDSARKIVDHYFRDGAASTQPKSKQKLREHTKQVKRVEDQKRMYANLEEEMGEYVLRETPLVGHIFVDTFNGRFRCCYPGQKDKSFSWTRRGAADAAKSALTQSWSWHALSTGASVPPHLGLEL